MGEVAIEALQAEAYPDFLRSKLQAYLSQWGGLRLRINQPTQIKLAYPDFNTLVHLDT